MTVQRRRQTVLSFLFVPHFIKMSRQRMNITLRSIRNSNTRAVMIILEDERKEVCKEKLSLYI